MNKRNVISILISFIIIIVACKRKCPNCAEPPNPLKTIVLQDKKYISDSYVVSTALTNNYGTDTKIYTSAWTYSGTDVDIYLLLQFDYSSIPSTATIKSAKLTLYADTSTNDVLNQLVAPGHYDNGFNGSIISNLNSTWNESTVTWNTAPSNTTASEVIISPTVTSSDSVYIDVTNLIMDQRINGTFGFKLALQNFIPYNRLLFYSSEMTAYPKRIPKLLIQYQ
jgi:hypothetical protein